MPTLRWTRYPAAASHTGPVVVMASRFRVRGFRHVVPFLRDAMRVRAQVARTPGAVGMSLVAHPLRREFATLSAWTSREAVDGLVRTEPHRSVMRRHAAAMADSRFVFWEADAADLPIDPADAHARLAEPA